MYFPGPRFSSGRPRLSRSSAQFVDVIHTSGYWIGLEDAVGHADFYPNSLRSSMPGCRKVIFKLAKVPIGGQCCSHDRAHYYYRESIRNPNAFRAR